jgi:hypothetical protein
MMNDLRFKRLSNCFLLAGERIGKFIQYFRCGSVSFKTPGSGSGFYCFVTLYDFLSLKNDVNVRYLQKIISK